MDRMDFTYNGLIKQVDTYDEYISNVEYFFDMQAWKKASSLHSKDSYNEYIKEFPDGKYLEEAQLLVKEFEEWDKCNQTKSAASYNDYLKLYPNGLFAKEANTLLQKIIDKDKKEWIVATKKDSIGAYEKYLSLNIDKQHILEAKARLDELNRDKDAWNNAIKKDTVEAYKRYVKEFPNGKYITDANKKIDELTRFSNEDEKAWKEAHQEDSINSYTRYKEKFPKGKYISKATEKLSELNSDKKAFEDAKKKDPIYAYDSYISKYPNGKYINQAKEKLKILRDKQKKAQDLMDEENRFWEDCHKSEDKEEAYSFYLQRYPNGMYVDKAKALLKRENILYEYKWLLEDTNPDRFLDEHGWFFVIYYSILILFSFSFLYEDWAFIKGFGVFFLFAMFTVGIYELFAYLYSDVPKISTQDVEVSKEIFDKYDKYEVYDNKHFIIDKNTYDNENIYKFKIVFVNEILEKSEKISKARGKIDVYWIKVMGDSAVIIFIFMTLSHVLLFRANSMFFYDKRKDTIIEKIAIRKSANLIDPDKNICKMYDGEYDSNTKLCSANINEAKKICQVYGGRLTTEEEYFLLTEKKKYKDFINQGSEDGIWLNTRKSNFMSNLFNTILRPINAIKGGVIGNRNPLYVDKQGIHEGSYDDKHIVKCIDDKINYYYKAFDND